jgi:5-hydroxyisourate hydrolase
MLEPPAAPRSAVTTHVLDTARGQPAAGLAVRLESVASPAAPELIAATRTDAGGRVSQLGPAQLAAGPYRLVFDTAGYAGAGAFFPEVSVTFVVGEADAHCHVPLLLSPFGYTTYRGS